MLFCMVLERRWLPGVPDGMSLEQGKFPANSQSCQPAIPPAKVQPHQYFFSCCCDVGPHSKRDLQGWKENSLELTSVGEEGLCF